MNRMKLIDQLKAPKPLADSSLAGAQTPSAAPGAASQPAASPEMPAWAKEVSAKLDALAKAVAQMLESLPANSQELADASKEVDKIASEMPA